MIMITCNCTKCSLASFKIISPVSSQIARSPPLISPPLKIHLFTFLMISFLPQQISNYVFIEIYIFQDRDMGPFQGGRKITFTW